MSKKQYVPDGTTAGLFRHRPFLRQKMPGRTERLIFIVILSIGMAHATATADTLPLPSWFQPSLLWSGSYHQDGDLLNRGDAQFRLNVTPLLDFTVRTQLLDERPTDDMTEGLSVFGTGIYHNPTGSRVLYGPLDVSGLPARIKNIYRHGAPFVVNHSRSSVDLKTDPGTTALRAFAAHLASPPLWGWQTFAAFTDERDDNRRRFLFGINTAETTAKTAPKNRIQAAAEFSYQSAVLPEKSVTGWFTDKPPLPERDTHLYAGTLHLLSPLVSAAADIAYSETFAFGRGMYGNMGLQLGNRPWRLSLAADTTTPRFVDGAGAVPGQGFRIGGKIERFLPRGEIWRAETTLRGYGDGEDAFTRSSSTLYYHFPSIDKTKDKTKEAKTKEEKAKKIPFSLAQVSLGATRNAVNSTKILDSWNAALVVNVGKASLKTSGALGEYTHDDEPSPFPDRDCTYVISNWRLDEEVVVPFDLFTLTAAIGYLKKLDATTALWKDAEIPLSLSARLHITPGRFTVKLAFSDFPQNGKLSVSWRFG
ncbi:MAG: hypothetical protein LBT00_11885 [Spirochaetaceae bacterium]|nr:hypothetical protein [Spirochaetaceae bacterium]